MASNLNYINGYYLNLFVLYEECYKVISRTCDPLNWQILPIEHC